MVKNILFPINNNVVLITNQCSLNNHVAEVDLKSLIH